MSEAGSLFIISFEIFYKLVGKDIKDAIRKN